MATFFVSKTGNDSNNGASAETAKLTIGAAVTLVNGMVLIQRLLLIVAAI